MRVKWRLGIQGLGRPPSPTSAVSIRHRKRAVKYNKSKLSATYSHTTAKHYEVPFRASGIGQFRKSINRFMRSDNGPCFIVPPQIKHSRLYGFMVDLFAFRNYRGVIIFMVGKSKISTVAGSVLRLVYLSSFRPTGINCRKYWVSF